MLSGSKEIYCRKVRQFPSPWEIVRG